MLDKPWIRIPEFLPLRFPEFIPFPFRLWLIRKNLHWVVFQLLWPSWKITWKSRIRRDLWMRSFIFFKAMDKESSMKICPFLGWCPWLKVIRFSYNWILVLDFWQVTDFLCTLTVNCLRFNKYHIIFRKTYSPHLRRIAFSSNLHHILIAFSSNLWHFHHVFS